MEIETISEKSLHSVVADVGLWVLLPLTLSIFLSLLSANAQAEKETIGSVFIWSSVWLYIKITFFAGMSLLCFWLLELSGIQFSWQGSPFKGKIWTGVMAGLFSKSILDKIFSWAGVKEGDWKFKVGGKLSVINDFFDLQIEKEISRKVNRTLEGSIKEYGLLDLDLTSVFQKLDCYACHRRESAIALSGALGEVFHTQNTKFSPAIENPEKIRSMFRKTLLVIGPKQFQKLLDETFCQG